MTTTEKKSQSRGRQALGNATKKLKQSRNALKAVDAFAERGSKDSSDNSSRSTSTDSKSSGASGASSGKDSKDSKGTTEGYLYDTQGNIVGREPKPVTGLSSFAYLAGMVFDPAPKPKYDTEPNGNYVAASKRLRSPYGVSASVDANSAVPYYITAKPDYTNMFNLGAQQSGQAPTRTNKLNDASIVVTDSDCDEDDVDEAAKLWKQTMSAAENEALRYGDKKNKNNTRSEDAAAAQTILKKAFENKKPAEKKLEHQHSGISVRINGKWTFQETGSGTGTPGVTPTKPVAYNYGEHYSYTPAPRRVYGSGRVSFHAESKDTHEWDTALASNSFAQSNASFNSYRETRAQHLEKTAEQLDGNAL